MLQANLLALFWEGFEPVRHTLIDGQMLQIELRPRASHHPTCGRCGQATWLIHDVERRRVRERDLFCYRVWLEVPVRRVRWASCGPPREHIPWQAGRRVSLDTGCRTSYRSLSTTAQRGPSYPVLLGRGYSQKPYLHKQA